MLPLALLAGFAVVKRGRDKKTDDAVAIKVRFLYITAIPSRPVPRNAAVRSCRAGAETLPKPFAPQQVVDKSRYASGDTSLEREIEVLSRVDHPNCIKLLAVYITARKARHRQCISFASFRRSFPHPPVA